MGILVVVFWVLMLVWAILNLVTPAAGPTYGYHGLRWLPWVVIFALGLKVFPLHGVVT